MTSLLRVQIDALLLPLPLSLFVCVCVMCEGVAKANADIIQIVVMMVVRVPLLCPPSSMPGHHGS